MGKFKKQKRIKRNRNRRLTKAFVEMFAALYRKIGRQESCEAIKQRYCKVIQRMIDQNMKPMDLKDLAFGDASNKFEIIQFLDDAKFWNDQILFDEIMLPKIANALISK
jgi:hypothetical protein